MSQHSNSNDNTRNRKIAIFRQMVACTFALGIMGLGAWSLLGQEAPYHPDVDGAVVTRSGTDLVEVNEEN